MTDAELLGWLSNQDGSALISDDAGRWVVCGDGWQDLPKPEPSDMNFGFHVEAHEWRPTIRDAIRAAMEDSDEG